MFGKHGPKRSPHPRKRKGRKAAKKRSLKAEKKQNKTNVKTLNETP